MVDFPDDVKYAKTHEWARVEDDVATVGISDYAQSQLGDIVFIDLPDVGRSVSAGEEAGSIESAKAVAELKMPVSGEIIEKNEELSNSPDLVNKSPFADGWMLKIKMSDPSEMDNLLSAEDYQPTCE
jgi:glycine cleavage system H protein